MSKTLTEQVLNNIKASKKKGCSKAGRNKVKCSYYRAVKSRSNKLRKLDKHLVTHVNDRCAIGARERLNAAIV
jgi:hypothetical protein